MAFGRLVHLRHTLLRAPGFLSPVMIPSARVFRSMRLNAMNSASVNGAGERNSQAQNRPEGRRALEVAFDEQKSGLKRNRRLKGRAMDLISSKAPTPEEYWNTPGI